MEGITYHTEQHSPTVSLIPIYHLRICFRYIIDTVGQGLPKMSVTVIVTMSGIFCSHRKKYFILQSSCNDTFHFNQTQQNF